MKVELAYGRGFLPVELPEGRTTIIQPRHRPGLADERQAILQALDQPVASEALSKRVRATDRICVLFTDITRATPNHRIIPWLLEYLDGCVPSDQITLLNQLGTHRANTREELEQMLTPEVCAKYRVLNHEPHSREACVHVGTTRNGSPALLNRNCVEADLRIVTGFIEPHFFAGFSGGPKGIMPGVAHVDTVMSNHGARNIGHPNATFGVTDGNPIWEEMRDIALRAGPSFLLNVALNDHRQITGVFAGDLIEAHRVGIQFVRSSAMQLVEGAFDVVVTTNSGYPLDQNLYQGVKGMAAGARILKPGGTLILVAECREGVPAESPYDRLLHSGRSPAHLLELLAHPGFAAPEQWQVQVQALVQTHARVLIHSSLTPDTVRAAHLEPCPDIAGAVVAELERKGPGTRIAVLPQGPLTIPLLQQTTIHS